MIRPAGADDMGLVYKSWIRCYARSPYAGAMSRGRLIEAIKGTIYDLLDRDECILSVACSPDDPTHLYGFVCYEPGGVLHFLYVKELYRGMGVGRCLLSLVDASQGIRYTHRTKACAGFLPVDATYQPNLSRRYLRRASDESDARAH